VLERVQAVGFRAVVITADGRSNYFERDLHDYHTGGRVRQPNRTRSVAWNPYRVSDIYPWPEFGWGYLDAVRPLVKVPLLLKGVLSPEDAKLAVEHGADGIIVSNHGGRVLDYAPSTIESLPAVVEAVGGRVPVLVDSGFRHGTDVFKALALGARGVLLGRAARWALGAFGAPGVQRLLELLREDLADTMKHAGRATVASIDRSCVGVRFS
jgi:4-hydroxymandelate oxidase